MNDNWGSYHNPLDELKRFFSQGSALSILIIVNAAVWVMIQAVKVIFFFYNHPDGDAVNLLFLHAFAIPASVPMLTASPWTLITYMFLHFDVWHILFNMLWLYWFGRIFLEFLRPRQLVLVYLLGGMTGGLFYVLIFNVFPVFADMLPISFALGASASVMAIVSAISFSVPNYTIHLMLIGRLKIIYLAVILFVFDFFMIPSGNAGGHIAHIGGAVFGALYALLYRYSGNRKLAGEPFSLFSTFISRFRRRRDDRNSHRNSAGRPLSDEEYNTRKRDHQLKIDEILDKISKGGYDCLTKEEKEFLFRSSGKR